MEEKWKPILGYEGYYEISNYGNVRTLERVIERSDGIKQTRKARVTRTFINNDGYVQVKLNKDGKATCYNVHRLVAQAFLENPNNLPEVNHIDLNRSYSITQ